MSIDILYFVPKLEVGFPGIILDWNPEMGHFRRFQPGRSSGNQLLDPPLNRHFPSRTSSEGLSREWTPLGPYRVNWCSAMEQRSELDLTRY